MAIKKDHSKILGLDLDPKGDMEVDIKPDGDCSVKYKGGNMNYDTYVDELEDRANKSQKGRAIIGCIGVFSGVSFDRNGKIIKN